MIKFVMDNSYTFVLADRGPEFSAVKEALKYQINDWRMIRHASLKKYPRSSYWKKFNGVNSFFIEKHKCFLTGLLGRATQFCKANGLAYEVIDKRKRPPEPSLIHPDILEGITLYDYQMDAIQGFIQASRGVAQLATGAGKTEVAIAITAALQVPTLFLTHRVDLMYQTAERFAARMPRLRDKIGIVGAGVWQPHFITMATAQTAQSMLKRHPDVLQDALQDVRLLIIDEAHRSGSDMFQGPAKLCTNAYYRLALTATPFMSGNSFYDMCLMGISGRVVAKVTNGELIDRGILARPFFKFFTIEGPDLNKLSGWGQIYESGIVLHEKRNLFIASQAKKLADMGKKILIIVSQVKHGKILRDLIASKGVKVTYQDGKNTTSERRKALAWLSKNSGVLIATNIFDEGIDVSAIDAIILAAGTKSAPALFQRTGRAIRKKEHDNYAIVIDFIDKQHTKLLEHSLKRYNLIKNEKGFTIL